MIRRPFILLSVFFLSFSSLVTAGLPPASEVALSGIDDEYASQLESLSSKAGLLGEFFQLKRADKALSIGDSQAAVNFAKRSNAPLFAFWRSIIMAEAALSLGKHEVVLDALKHLPRRPDILLSWDETAYRDLYQRALTARYQAKKLLKQSVSEEAAELMSLFPDRDDVKTGLGADSVVSLTIEQKVRRVSVLNTKYQYKQVPGIITAEEISHSNLSGEEKCRAFAELGNALKQVNGQAEQAIAAFYGVIDSSCSDKYTPRAMYWAGVLGSTDAESAERVLIQLAERYPRHRLTDDAYYKLYKKAEKKGDVAAEQRWRGKLMALKTGDMRNTLLFEEAFPLYQKGQYSAAAEILKAVAEGTPTKDESYPQGVYWYARSVEKAGGKKGTSLAKPYYEKLVHQFPFSYYAILSGKRIGKSVAVPALPTLGGTVPSDGGEAFSVIDDLNAAGFHDAASEVLDVALNMNPQWEIHHQEFLTRKLIESQHYRKSLELASQHFDSGAYGTVYAETDPMFAAFYPPAYRKEAQKAYSACHLPRGAIEGIMREESLFQKNVKSWVGATGLMQLMPATASMVARQLGDSYGVSFSDLTHPQANIYLGSRYLKDVLDKFDGQMPLAIMSYNAGPGNAAKWLKLFGDKDFDEFVETIPFSETRGYVKRVMRSMNVYGQYYGDSFFKSSFCPMHLKK